jgi:hypothetical protein
MTSLRSARAPVRRSRSPRSKLVRKEAFAAGSIRDPASRSMRRDTSSIGGSAVPSTSSSHSWSGLGRTDGGGGASTISTTSGGGRR